MTEWATKNVLIPITTVDKAMDATLFPLEQMIEMVSKRHWIPTQINAKNWLIWRNIWMQHRLKNCHWCVYIRITLIYRSQIHHTITTILKYL